MDGEEGEATSNGLRAPRDEVFFFHENVADGFSGWAGRPVASDTPGKHVAAASGMTSAQRVCPPGLRTLPGELPASGRGNAGPIEYKDWNRSVP